MRPHDQFDPSLSDASPRYGVDDAETLPPLPQDGQNSTEDPEELRAEIAETRAELDATVDAIQDRLNPEYLKAQAKDVVHDAADQAKEIVHEAVRDATEQAKGAVHDATVGKAEEAVSGAARTARGAGSTMIETIRQNPIPAALVGIGLGWMLFKHQSASGQMQGRETAYGAGWTGEGTYRGGRSLAGRQPSYNVPRYGAYRVDFDEGDDRAWVESQGRTGRTFDRSQNGAGQMVDRVQGTTAQMANKGQEMAGQVQDAAGHVIDQAQDMAGQFVETVQERSQQVTGTAQGQFERMLRDNPLVLGGLAVAAGLAVGLVVPESEKEDELLGEARDSLMQQARETAQDAQQRLQQVAQEAGKAAQNEAKEQHLNA